MIFVFNFHFISLIFSSFYPCDSKLANSFFEFSISYSSLVALPLSLVHSFVLPIWLKIFILFSIVTILAVAYINLILLGYLLVATAETILSPLHVLDVNVLQYFTLDNCILLILYLSGSVYFVAFMLRCYL